MKNTKQNKKIETHQDLSLTRARFFFSLFASFCYSLDLHLKKRSVLINNIYIYIVTLYKV